MRRIKPKTVRRLTLLAVLLVLAVGAVVAVVWVRGWQLERRVARERAAGLAAFARGEYYDAIGHLRHSLERNREDGEALAAYAESRRNLPESDGRHLKEAVQFFEQALVFDRENPHLRAQLLDLYVEVGQNVEARDLARRMRPENLAECGPEHADTLEREAAALLHHNDLRAFDATMARLVELGTVPVDLLVQRVATAVRAGKAREATEVIDRFQSARPNDPRVELLRLAATAATDARSPLLLPGLCALTGVDEQTAAPPAEPALPDAMSALICGGLFDMIGKPEHAFAVMRGADAVYEHDSLAALTTRRLWQRGEPEAVVRRVDDGPVPPEVRSDMLAFKGLALLDLGRLAEAEGVAKDLDAIEGDFAARAWAMTLTALCAQQTADPRDTMTALTEAAAVHPHEPVITFLLGNTLARLSRFDAARDRWKEAARSPLAIGWTAPTLRASESLLLEGRASEAADAATAAAITSSSNPAAMLAWIETETTALQQDLRTRAQAQTLLDRAEALLSARPADAPSGARDAFDRLEITRVVALARLTRREEAVSGASALIERDPAVSGETLERLALASQRESLGLAARCLERAAELKVEPTPALVLAVALEQANRGKPEEGLAALRGAATAHQGPDATRWEMAVAQFLELTGDEAAVHEWRGLVDRRGTDLEVLRAALTAPSLAKDGALVQRTVDAFLKGSGATVNEAPAFLQVARARALLAQPQTPRRTVEEAVGILYQVVGEAPRLIEARELLIDALTRTDPSQGLKPDLPAAMSQIETAANFAPRPSVFLLRGARLMQQARDYERARSLLRRVAGDGNAVPEARREAAVLLTEQGDYSAAVGPLESLVDADREQPEPTAMLALARCYTALRRDAEAQALYVRLADAPLTDAQTIVDVAAALDTAGDAPGASRVMERLAALDLEPSDRLLALGRFAARRGDREGAKGRFEDAARTAPQNGRAWDALINYHLDAGDTATAGGVLSEALQSIPDDPQLRILEQRIVINSADDGSIDLNRLSEALQRDPARARAAAAVAALEEARKAGRLDQSRHLLALAQQFDDVLAMQGYVARRLLVIPGADPGNAVSLAARAFDRFPTDPEAARLCVEVYATLEQWPEMLRAAQAWQVRDESRPVEADLAVADARVRLGQPTMAVELLRGRIPAALNQPEDRVPSMVIQTFARALAVSGQETEAHAMLTPLLAVPAIRDTVWVPIAATVLGEAAAAEQWMQEAAKTLVPLDASGHLTLARGYGTLAARFTADSERHLQAGLAVLEPAVATGQERRVEALELQGLLRRQAGDLTGAAESLRQALEIEPARHAAVAALIQVLAAGGRGGEATDAAQRAVSAAGETNIEAVLNLARAQAAALPTGGDPASAATALQTYAKGAELAPGRLDILLEAAALCESTRNPRGAVGWYRRALALRLPSRELGANIRNNAAFALCSADPSREELTEARSWAISAVEVSPVAAYLDTLARIEAAMGSRDAAAAAYRRALEADNGSISAGLGYAGLLAGGTSAEQEDARALLSRIENAPGLTPGQRAELEAVRRRLGQ